MASRSTGPNVAPLVVIVGQTASGKTALAIELAKRFGGEIICADSRTVYKGMDIGTAKPTATEQQGIRHYGLDIVSPGESFSAFDFKRLAEKAIAEISARGKLPILVGGTGLYIDAVLYDFAFRTAPSRASRSELKDLSVAALQQKVLAAGYELPHNASNPRHLTRLLESGPSPKHERVLRTSTLVLGLQLPKPMSEARITARVDLMFGQGLVKEVRGLLGRYGSVEALKAPGYKAVASYIKGEVDLAEAKRQFARDDLRLAKRQRTWFKRSADVHWLDNGDALAEAVALVTSLLDS